MKPRHLLLLILFNVVWGGTFAMYKQLEPHLDYEGIVTLRFGLAALGALALWPWLPGRAPQGWDLAKAMLIGVAVFVIGHRLQVLGNGLGLAGNSAVLMAAEPLVTSLAAAAFLREHVPPRRWFGFALAVLGVLLLNGVWRADFRWLGLTASALILLSFLGETAYSIIGKPVVQRAGPFKVLGVALLTGLVCNLLLAGGPTWQAARGLPLESWGLLVFMGLVATLAGYGVWFVVIRESAVSLAALTIFIQPLIGVPLAALWPGETPHWGQLWGSAAIVSGLMVGLLRFRAVPAVNDRFRQERGCQAGRASALLGD
jgi:O-acetylserine/cysteine efflux transporter